MISRKLVERVTKSAVLRQSGGGTYFCMIILRHYEYIEVKSYSIMGFIRALLGFFFFFFLFCMAQFSSDTAELNRWLVVEIIIMG